MGSYDYSTLCRHVDAETPEKTCQIKGTLPSWLNGFVMLNGPALTKVGDSEYKHAFDSSALLQKIKIENGQVSYKTKFLRSDTYKKNQKANAITVAEFGTPGPSNKGVLSRLANSIDSDKMMSDNAVLNVVNIGEKFYAVGETPFYFEVDPNSLDIKKRINMNKAFSFATQTVHVIKDEDGYYYTCAQAVGITGPKYAIMRFPSDGDIEKGKVVATLPCRWRLSPCYIHSIIMTKNYLILIEPPLAVSLMELLSDVLTNTPFIEGLHWQEEKALFHIFDRKTWKPLTTSYTSDPFFFLHFCNAYEESGQLIVELCAYKDSQMMQNMFISKLRDASKNPSSDFHAPFCSYLKRFVIPINVTSAQEGQEMVTFPNSNASAKKIKKDIFLKPEDLSSVPFEHPTRNDNFSKTGNSYVWGMGPSPNGENYGQILKLNLQTKEIKIFKEEGFYPTPSIFIPSPSGQKEDDGIVLALSLSSTNIRLLTILFLDATNLTEVCRATLELDTTVPVPLHGCFTPFK